MIRIVSIVTLFGREYYLEYKGKSMSLKPEINSQLLIILVHSI